MALSKEVLREMFWTMLLSRRLDERAWVLHRQGKIAFHVSGIGHEAAQVGTAYAIQRGYDWVAPYYRDLAMLLSLGFTPLSFALSLMGKQEDPTSGGKQMPSHWSMRKANVISSSSVVATQTPHAVGIALGIKLRKEDKVVLTTTGEGSTSQGEWYEAVNWAAVQKLPVVFLVENNIYAISVPQHKQMAVENVADKARGLGLPGVLVDGNDLQAVYGAVHGAAASARKGNGPSLVEARLYRITPHSSDDDDRTYRSREEVEEHKKNDPLLLTREHLEGKGIITPKLVDEMEEKAKTTIDEAIAYAESAPYPTIEEGLKPVYAEEVAHG